MQLVDDFCAALNDDGVLAWWHGDFVFLICCRLLTQLKVTSVLFDWLVWSVSCRHHRLSVCTDAMLAALHSSWNNEQEQQHQPSGNGWV